LNIPGKINFELPREDEHVLIVGRNGTGKTQAGLYWLSKRPLSSKPWFVLDYKREEMLANIPRARYIDFKDTPSEPGLYILQSGPDPDLQDATELWLRRLWQKMIDGEPSGVFVDEGYMLPQRSPAFSALLTQGRSKRNPVITLSQRPVRVDRTAISEASHVIAFDLNDKRDHKSLEEVVPTGLMATKVQPFHSRWYAVKKDKVWIVDPVAEADEIVDAINSQLPALKRWL
jgi:hypothetical protein